MNNNIKLIKKAGFIILLAFTILEVIYFPEIKNLYLCIVFIYAWGLMSEFVLTKKHLSNYFLPTVAITGHVFNFYFLPLVITFIEGKPVTCNFQVPFLMAGNHFLNITSIVCAYLLCIKCYRPYNYISRFWNKIGFYNAPSDKMIWIMGFIGFAFLIYDVINQTNGANYIEELHATGNAASGIRAFFKTFAFFPICLLYKDYYGSNSSTNNRVQIYLYILLLSLVGIASTRRVTIFNTIATIAFLYLFIKVFYENRKILSLKVVILLSVAVYLITGPAFDLAAAMILNRHNLKGGSTFSSVIRLYNDKETLHNLYKIAMTEKDNGGNNRQGWSEYYVDNIFFDRFCNIRVLDVSLYYAQSLGFNNPKMHNYLKETIINKIPSFIIDDSGFEKTVHTTPSDFMYASFFGVRQTASNRVSGETGVGLYLFGYWYYPFAFFIYFFIFYLFCSYCKKRHKLIIPIPIMSVFFFNYYMYFDNAYGIFRSIEFLVRDGWQNNILYCMFLYVLNIFNRKS